MLLVAGVAILLAAYVEWPRWQRRRAIVDLQARLSRPLEEPGLFRDGTPLSDFAWYLNSGMDPKDCIAVNVEPEVYNTINRFTDLIVVEPDDDLLPINTLLQRKLEPMGLAAGLREGRLVIFVEP
jgi:hypothetical protein